MIVQLEPEIESQIDEVAHQTGETKDSLVRHAVLSFLEDLRDAQIIEERIKNPGKRFTLEEIVQKYGLDD